METSKLGTAAAGEAAHRRSPETPTRARRKPHRSCGVRRPWLAWCLAAVGLWALASGPSQAATWAPSLGLSARAEQHRTAAGRDTIAGVLTPQLAVNGGPGVTRFTLFARREYQLGCLACPGRHLPSLDLISDRATLGLGRVLAEAESLLLGGRYARTRDPFEIDERAAVASADARRWVAWIRGNRGPVEGAYRIEGWGYEAPGPSDAIALSWSASLLPLRSPMDAWLVGWRQRQLEIGSTWAFRSRMAVVGFRRTLSPLLSGRIEVGASDVELADRERRLGPALVIELEGPEASPGATSTALRLQRDFATSVIAEIGHGWGDGRLSARWESVVDVEGGFYRELNFSRGVVVGAQDTLGRATVLGVETSYTRTWPLVFGGREARTMRASGWLVRRLRPWLIGRAGGSYLRQASVGPESVPAFRRVRVDAGLTVHFP